MPSDNYFSTAMQFAKISGFWNKLKCKIPPKIGSRIPLVTVELKMLPGEAQAATKFLQSKVQGQFKVDGNRIEIEDNEGLDVKLLLRKFLHHEGLTGYRVLSQSGTFRIVPDNLQAQEEQPRDDKIEGVPPFPPLSTERLPLMDIVYPNYTSDRPRIFKKEKPRDRP
jgi:hypothetical protein